MTARPMLFSAPMIRALLDGSKTQTRRTIKAARPEWVRIHPQPYPDADGRLCYGWDGNVGHAMRCLYGQPGDQLWVREAWRTERQFDHLPPRDLNPTWPTPVQYEAGPFAEVLDGKYRPPMFMPRWASRITLELTDVRVERLQAITRGDAMAEGCPFPNMQKGPDPREWYAELWDQINGPGAWDKNPWVWCLGFRRTA